MKAQIIGAALVLWCGFALAEELPFVPDPKLTPGVVASSDEKEVCATGPNGTYSQQHRQTSAAMKKEVYAMYGLPHPPPKDAKNWEVDHRLPLALGGADDVNNLWPQSRLTCPWNANVKDKLEDFLWHGVCKKHKISLADAQSALLGDWTKAYEKFMGQPPSCSSHIK